MIGKRLVHVVKNVSKELIGKNGQMLLYREIVVKI